MNKRPITNGPVGDPDPLEGRVPARKKMPYGWLSPRFGLRGWLGWALFVLFAAIMADLSLSWWATILGWIVVLMIPVELLRTDAIQMYGAVTFDFIEKEQPGMADNLFWEKRTGRYGGDARDIPPGHNGWHLDD